MRVTSARSPHCALADRKRSVPSRLRLRPVPREKNATLSSHERAEGSHRHCSVARSVPASAVCESSGLRSVSVLFHRDRPCRNPGRASGSDSECGSASRSCRRSLGGARGRRGGKGATLSDKTARKELGLTQDEIVQAIRAGGLHCRLNSVYGNPFLRLLRKEVEALVKTKYGNHYLKDRQANTELARIGRELKR